jgi:hypothetical protein
MRSAGPRVSGLADRFPLATASRGLGGRLPIVTAPRVCQRSQARLPSMSLMVYRCRYPDLGSISVILGVLLRGRPSMMPGQQHLQQLSRCGGARRCCGSKSALMQNSADVAGCR